MRLTSWRAQLYFITGTGTGVGKTVLCALLLQSLRRAGKSALALKPFCAGGRGDARLLCEIGGCELSLDEVNPFYFSEPLAPAMAAGRAGRRVKIGEAIAAIEAAAARCDRLLIEGAGGLLSPLGKDFAIAELAAKFRPSRVLLAAPNRLGVLSDVFLSIGCLEKLGFHRVKVVLMGRRQPDLSARLNAGFLQKTLRNRVFEVPYLGSAARRIESVKENEKKFEKVLARLW